MSSDRSKQWVDNSKVTNLMSMPTEKLHQNYRLCSRHFETTMFMNPIEKKKLVWNAVPTIFDEPKPIETISSPEMEETDKPTEDTEDASETEQPKAEPEYTEIKEQMYQDKLAQLKKQLQQLKDGTLPEFLKRNKKIEQQSKERLRMNEIWRDYELEVVEREYIKEKKQSAKEFEEKKIDLKESLIMELEDKKRMVDNERHTMELTGDSMDVKPIMTRKLRRRPNDPIPLPEKRRKPSPAQLNFFLDEMEIMEDLRFINKVSGKPVQKKPVTITNPTVDTYDAKIDEGKLYYNKNWFHRGQTVFIDSKESGKISGVISAVGTQEIWVRRTSDNGKMRIYVSQLQKGKFMIRRRTS